MVSISLRGVWGGGRGGVFKRSTLGLASVVVQEDICLFGPERVSVCSLNPHKTNIDKESSLWYNRDEDSTGTLGQKKIAT